MPTSSKIGYGSLLKRGNGSSPQTFTTVAEVTQIGEFGSERELLEVTNLDSPNTFKEYLLGMKDGVEFPVTVNFLPNNATQNFATGLMKDHNDGTARDFQFLVNGFGTFSFTALVRSWRASVNPNAPMTANFSLKVTGSIAYSAL
jgi:predicted secreted protein